MLAKKTKETTSKLSSAMEVEEEKKVVVVSSSSSSSSSDPPALLKKKRTNDSDRLDNLHILYAVFGLVLCCVSNRLKRMKENLRDIRQKLVVERERMVELVMKEELLTKKDKKRKLKELEKENQKKQLAMQKERQKVDEVMFNTTNPTQDISVQLVQGGNAVFSINPTTTIPPSSSSSSSSSKQGSATSTTTNNNNNGEPPQKKKRVSKPVKVQSWKANDERSFRDFIVKFDEVIYFLLFECSFL